MGLIDRFLGSNATITAVGNAATGVTEIFRENATRRMELDEEAHARALAQLGAEFAIAPTGYFDAIMNGINRTPRPFMALGTLGLFAYAMIDPPGFALRMEGLAQVPEPLWWLLGAIVSFYFGAREAHYFRRKIWPGTVMRANTGNSGALALDLAVERATASPRSQADPPSPSTSFDTKTTDLTIPPPDADYSDNAALADWARIMSARYARK